MLSGETDKKDCGLFQDLRKEYDHAVEGWKSLARRFYLRR